jgi:hypothetical protein
MKKLFIIIPCIVFCAIAFSEIPAPSGWMWYKEIALQQTSLDETDYVARIVVYREPGMSDTYTDISFIDSDSTTELYQYQQHIFIGSVPRDSTVYWVKVPFKPDTGKTIYMFYGNNNAIERRQPDSVFAFWDSGVSGDGDDMDATLRIEDPNPSHMPPWWVTNNKWSITAKATTDTSAVQSKWFFKSGGYIFLTSNAYLSPYVTAISVVKRVPVGYGVKVTFAKGYDSPTTLFPYVIQLASVDATKYFRWFDGLVQRFQAVVASLHTRSVTVPRKLSGVWQEIDIWRTSSGKFKFLFDNKISMIDTATALVFPDTLGISIYAKNWPFLVFHVMVYKLPSDTSINSITPPVISISDPLIPDPPPTYWENIINTVLPTDINKFNSVSRTHFKKVNSVE